MAGDPARTTERCTPVLYQLFDQHGPVGQAFRDPARVADHVKRCEGNRLVVATYVLASAESAGDFAEHFEP